MRDVDIDLIESVHAQDLAGVHAALNAGANVNVRDDREPLGHQNTPLHEAAIGTSLAIVRVLLAAGANVDVSCASGWTPLMRACNSGWLEAAMLLLDAGADPHAQNAEGYTALGRVPGTCTELIALLKASGAETRA